jgi:hypothetical protein
LKLAIAKWFTIAEANQHAVALLSQYSLVIFQSDKIVTRLLKIIDELAEDLKNLKHVRQQQQLPSCLMTACTIQQKFKKHSHQITRYLCFDYQFDLSCFDFQHN